MSHSSTIDSVPIRSWDALERAVSFLQAQGINISLERNAFPRNYYVNQMQRHFGQKTEICEGVIRVHDAHYDIGLIPDPDNPGAFKVAFDDYNSSPTWEAIQEHNKQGLNEGGKNRGPIRDYLGCAFDGTVKHWNNYRREDEQIRCSVGKLMQQYTKFAAIEAAEADGLVYIENAEGDRVNPETGELELEFEYQETE